MRTYQEITPEILTKLQQAAPGHVYTGDEINEDYSHDEMQIYGSHMPDVLIIPTSTEEISAVMKICNEHRVPVTTRGAGTAETGAPVPLYGGVLLSTEKFNHIKSFHPDDMSGSLTPQIPERRM
jgi:glycolate oxidase